ncbi:MAG: YqiA/YcfP family alpha/beta fold hydrolase [Burkholderiales bacterium]
MLIYLHGFNSSAQSTKARLLGGYLAKRGLAHLYKAPNLPHWPSEAIAVAEQAMAGHHNQSICFVGSSLGGFYATHLAEKHGAKAVLINPAVNPHRLLRSLLGPQTNLYSGETYQLTEEHLNQWAKLGPSNINPLRYLLLLETGDEVLDYRDALEKYAGARQVVVEGGDHSLQSFPEQIASILAFAGIEL